MQKETYDRLLNDKLNEIQEISKKIDYNNLTYYFKDPRSSSINFIKFKGEFFFLNKKMVIYRYKKQKKDKKIFKKVQVKSHLEIQHIKKNINKIQ